MADDPGGVYHSSAAERDWEPELDVGGMNHMLFDHGTSMAGIWQADPSSLGTGEPVAIPARETLMMLAGRVRVTVDGAAPVELRAGDMLSIPKGSLVGWDPDPDAVVFWIYS